MAYRPARVEIRDPRLDRLLVPGLRCRNDGCAVEAEPAVLVQWDAHGVGMPRGDGIGGGGGQRLRRVAPAFVARVLRARDVHAEQPDGGPGTVDEVVARDACDRQGRGLGPTGNGCRERRCPCIAHRNDRGESSRSQYPARGDTGAVARKIWKASGTRRVSASSRNRVMYSSIAVGPPVARHRQVP